MAKYSLRSFFRKPPKNGRYYLVAVDGRGGSGKTTLTQLLEKMLPGFLVINGDDYFEPTTKTIAWGDFNEKRFFADVISPIQRGETNISYKPYDWRSEPPIKMKKLTIRKGVCIERSFSFSFDLDWDVKIWVEAPSQTSLHRGLERDKMPKARAIRQWEEVWQPREDEHIAKTNPLKRADIVLDGTMPFEKQLSS